MSLKIVSGPTAQEFLAALLDGRKSIEFTLCDQAQKERTIRCDVDAVESDLERNLSISGAINFIDGQRHGGSIPYTALLSSTGAWEGIELPSWFVL